MKGQKSTNKEPDMKAFRSWVFLRATAQFLSTELVAYHLVSVTTLAAEDFHNQKDQVVQPVPDE